MARFNGALVGVLVALSCLSVLSGSAFARPRPEVHPASTGALIYLGESRGYSVGLSMPTPRIAVLYVLRIENAEPFDSANPAQVILESGYAVHVKGELLKRGRVRVVLPSLGRVSLRFKPNGKLRAHSQGNQCRGEPRVTEYGTFRGTVSLEGEGGYFKIAARHAAGSVTQVPRAVCRGASGKGDDEVDPRWEYLSPSFGFSYSPGNGSIALLYASSRTTHRTIGIRVAHSEGDPAGAEVDVQALELRHGMAIGRSANIFGQVPGTLTTSLPGEHPASATLKPPAPFHGEASYLENSSTSHSWTGDLSVSLLGLDLPLTGRQFRTSLCVVSPLKAPSGCDFLKPKFAGRARPNIPRAGRQG
jgi:hypothetical protein